MEAVKNEQHYGDISAEDVMRCIPRGLILHPAKPGWLLHCRRGNKLYEFPNDIGVKHHFARGGVHNPATSPPPPGNADVLAPAPPTPTQDAPPPPAPPSSVPRARFALGMPPITAGPAPPTEPRASTTSTAEPRATTTTALRNPSLRLHSSTRSPLRKHSTLPPPLPRPQTRHPTAASSTPFSWLKRSNRQGRLCLWPLTRIPATARHPGNSLWRWTTWQRSSTGAPSPFTLWSTQYQGHHLRIKKMHCLSETRLFKSVNQMRCSLGYMLYPGSLLRSICARRLRIPHGRRP